jgi:hypothetical protein
MRTAGGSIRVCFVLVQSYRDDIMVPARFRGGADCLLCPKRQEGIGTGGVSSG